MQRYLKRKNRIFRVFSLRARFCFALSLTLCFLLHSQAVSAQVYTGKVVGEESKALPGVSVILLHGKKSVVFTKTDASGLFRIAKNDNTEVDSIHFSQMGYEKLICPLSGFKDGQTIILSRKAYQLKEVKVKPQKIRQTGDTLNYLVSQFMQKQDRSIADVLAKMPGITVAPTGQISYNGTPINKFYIEGIDLSGGKYAMLSENLDARKVKKVQVMENHQPVRALRDIKFSEQAAVNIVLRDDVKNTWQGIAHIGAGTSLQHPGHGLYDEKLMGMFFARKKQSVSMYKSTNTGNDIEHEITDIEKLTGDRGDVDDLVSLSSVKNPKLNRNRYTFNDTHLFATNWCFVTPKKDNLRLQATSLFNRSRYQQYAQTIYNNVVGDSMVVEEQRQRSYRREYTAEMSYQINRDKSFVENTLKGFLDFNSGVGDALFNGHQIRQFVQPRKMSVSNRTKAIINIKDRNSITLNGFLSYNYLPEELLLVNGKTEKIYQKELKGEVSASFRHRVGHIYLSYLVGGKALLQNLSVSNYLTADSLREDRYGCHNLFLSPQLSYKSKDCNLNVGLRINEYYISNSAIHQSKVTIEPNLYFGWELNGRTEWTLGYGYHWIPVQLNSSTKLPVFSSYRTFFQGKNELEATRNHSILSALRYKDIVKGWFANASVSYLTVLDSRMLRGKLLDGVYYSSFTNLYTHSHLLRTSEEVTKSFDWASLMLTLRLSQAWNYYSMLIGNTPKPFVTRNYTTYMGLSMRPLRWFSLEASGNLLESQFRSRERNMPSSKPVRLFTESLSLFFFLDKWQFSYMGEFYHNKDITSSFTHFSNISVSYQKKNYEFSLQLSNLFGMREYRQRMITTTSFAYTETMLRPKEVLAKIIFSL